MTKRYGVPEVPATPAAEQSIQYQTIHMELNKKIDALIPVIKTHNWDGPTITRQELIEATQHTIDTVSDLGEDENPLDPTEDEIASCMAVAHTAHFITGGWVSGDNDNHTDDPAHVVEQCGCLIGTLRMAEGLEANPMFDHEHQISDFMGEVADQFPDSLQEVTGVDNAFATFLVVD